MRAVLVALALAVATSAAAQTPPSGAPAAKEAAANTVSPATAVGPKATAPDDPNKLVCKSEPVLGSRLPVRRCRTVADIRDRQLQDRQSVEHAQILQEPSK